MALQKLQFKPGVVRDLTAYTVEGGWVDCNLIRFRLGFAQSIGGWEKYSQNSFVGMCRTLFGWSTLGGQNYLAVGTTSKYYIENGSSFYDVTPIRRSVSLSGPFTATTGSAAINVYDVGHGATAGDYVTFSGATTLGGNITDTVLNKEYSITSLVDGDNYIITASVAASVLDIGNGGTTAAAYQINTGVDSAVGGAGWGAGTWSRGTWGSSVTLTSSSTLRLWSQDTWGEDLIFGVRNGGIYYWDKTGGLSTRAVTLESLSTDSTCPNIATQILVSDRDRHLIAFAPNDGGATDQDAMLIRWCTQEDYAVWYPQATNTAGDLRLGTGSKIVRAVETKREILVFTDLALYSMQFIGPPYTFGVQQVSTNVTTSGFNAFAVVEDVVFWMGKNKFYLYSGSVDELQCTLKDHVFNNINTDQLDKVYVAVNSEFNEITWFYPSEDSTENNVYVTYNYSEKAWAYGSMARTAWLDRGVNTYPIAAGAYDTTGAANHLYNQEVGANDGSATNDLPLNAYIQSAPFDIGEGDSFSFIKRIIPDVNMANSTGSTNPAVTMTIKMQNYPGGDYTDTSNSPVTQTAVLPIELYTEQMFVRLRGRQASFRIESNQIGTRWILGSPRIDLQPDGRR